MIFEYSISPVIPKVSAARYFELGIVRPKHSRAGVSCIFDFRGGGGGGGLASLLRLILQLENDFLNAVLAILFR